ncbi:MAG: EF-hand domain-containing protein, partial [Pseudomonadota bacterium]
MKTTPTLRRAMLTAAVAAGLATPALADGPGMFRTLDQDRNGQVEWSELGPQPSMQRHFADADTNGDGQLSLAEFEALLSHPEVTL